MVEVFVSESHDWVVVRNKNKTIHEGHSISVTDFVCLLRELGHKVRDIEIPDKMMEEGVY
jgi:hypothetical protein